MLPLYLKHFVGVKLKEIKDLKPGDYLLTNECLVLDVSELSETQNRIMILGNNGVVRCWITFKDFQFYIL